MAAAVDLLSDVRNYLDITFEDEGTDTKLTGIISRGMNYIDAVASVAQDYKSEGAARALLLDYCRYARNNMLEYFEQNFTPELITLRMGVQVNDYSSDSAD